MKKLRSPLRIGQLELAHRIVTALPAAPQLDAAGYRERATAGGLVITEACTEDPADEGRWQRLSGGIHEAGGIAVALLAPGRSDQQPHRVEIERAMDALGRAARLARAAGFDGVELDASAGSLAERFLQPQANSRDDAYGGDAERRMTFLLEAADVVAQEWSNERLGVRLSPCSREGQLELFAEVMRALSERELAYVHLANICGPKARPPGGRSDSIAACADRQAFRSDLSCALIASDYVELTDAAFAVESRWADAIGFFQAIDDATFVERLLGGEQR